MLILALIVMSLSTLYAVFIAIAILLEIRKERHDESGSDT